jgi:large subunit ribosomal protein L29
LDISAIHALTDEQLETELDNSHRELMNLRFRLSTRQINSPQELRKVKKTIARLKTVMRLREVRES